MAGFYHNCKVIQLGEEKLVQDKRLLRERDTIEKMVMLYCRSKHAQENSLCDECRELLAYASARLNYCKFGGQKPVCAKCPIHCYRPDMRAKVVAVMRYAGPRMLYAHPLLALRHILDGFTAK